MRCCAIAAYSNPSALGLRVPQPLLSRTCDLAEDALTMGALISRRFDGWVSAKMLLGCCGKAAAKMAPPPLESPHAPAGSLCSPSTSANTRLTEPREIGPTVTAQPLNGTLSHPKEGIACRLDTASRLHTRQH